MANMSYCRFQNTLSDLYDCLSALQSRDIESKAEKQAARDLLLLCRDIASDYADDFDEEEMQDPRYWPLAEEEE